MKLSIGLHEIVQVRLTDQGQRLWFAYKTRPFENSAMITGGGDLVRAPLWELMHAFGPALDARRGLPAFFEDDEIGLPLPARSI